jgi:DNA-directed RNA polymerase specialized sigma subunit
VTTKPTSAEYKSKDLELWTRWNQTRSDADLQALLNQMSPIIAREINKWAPATSRSLLESEARRLAVEAFYHFDPKAGATLSTYLASRLPKVSRMVYSQLNVARLSETKTLQWGTVQTATNELKDRHGREPTHDELADHLGWTPKKLASFLQHARRNEFVESEAHPEFSEGDDHLIDFIYNDLTPQQKKIFEYTSGYGGVEILSGKEILSKLKITQGVLSYQKELIKRSVKAAQQEKPHG